MVVRDTTKPVITLLGNATLTVDKGKPYADAGATAMDNYDGNITSRMVVSDPVDVNTAGTYNITYDVSDAAGNKAETVVRTVRVADNLLPLLLIGVVALVLIVGAGAVGALVLYLWLRRRKI